MLGDANTMPVMVTPEQRKAEKDALRLIKAQIKQISKSVTQLERWTELILCASEVEREITSIEKACYELRKMVKAEEKRDRAIFDAARKVQRKC
jgi:hypothetical protein